MAISVNWATQVINVPRADMLLIQSSPSEIRQLDIDAFRLELKALEASEYGMAFLDTHQHNPPVTVGGVTLARVVEIINGYTVTFEDGQYAVNLVGANSNIADVTNVNQVSVRSANSAGLTFSEEINAQSFINAAVYIDVDNGNPGTQFPRGTPTDPVNNWPDAEAIAADRGFSNFDLKGTLSLTGTDNIPLTRWFGHSTGQSQIVLTGGITTNAAFVDMTVNGQCNGNIFMRQCHTDGLTDFQGQMEMCGFQGDVTVNSACTSLCTFDDCRSHIAGSGRPTIDVNGAACGMSIRNWIGGLTIAGVTQGNNISCDVGSGTIEAAVSNTSGLMVLRGVGTFVDNSGIGYTVVQDGFVEATYLTFVKDVAEADEQYTAAQATKFKKGTATVLIQKNVSGGSVPNPPIDLTE